LKAGLAAALLLPSFTAVAQEARFFRILGPTAATITTFQPGGAIIWSNAVPGSNYTVQTVAALPGGTNWVDYVQLAAAQPVNTNTLVDFNPPAGMALIPAGVFTMGNAVAADTDITDAPPTNVSVLGFYMDTNLVTSSLWQTVYDWAGTNGYRFENSGEVKSGNDPAQNPVVTVDWYDCVKWCNARSQQAGKTPVYYTDAALTQVFTNGDPVVVYPNWSAQGFRLPTEAEWEKAARGGLIGQRFPWGNLINENLADYRGDTSVYPYDLGPNGFNAIGAIGGTSFATTPVGSFPPNGYGLYDMAGNVFEWCWDWYGTPYAGGTNPTGPSSGTYRVVRGGTWSAFANYCRSGFRGSSAPSDIINTDTSIGLRTVMSAGQ
jgi:formylglycine-generating enzyme required for sulfatase activity